MYDVKLFTILFYFHVQVCQPRGDGSSHAHENCPVDGLCLQERVQRAVRHVRDEQLVRAGAVRLELGLRADEGEDVLVAHVREHVDIALVVEVLLVSGAVDLDGNCTRPDRPVSHVDTAVFATVKQRVCNPETLMRP